MRYRKVAAVEARVAEADGVMHTLEGDHSFKAGDYICGPGAAGEFWPVRKDIFEATYVPATEPPADLDVERLARALEKTRYYKTVVMSDGIQSVVKRPPEEFAAAIAAAYREDAG